MPLDQLMRAAFEAANTFIAPLTIITGISLAIAIAVTAKRSRDALLKYFHAEQEAHTVLYEKLKNDWADQQEEKPKRKNEELDRPSTHLELGDDGELIEVEDH